MNRPLWVVFDLFLIFSATFSGGYPYGHIPIFYVFWLLILLRRRFEIFPFEIRTQVFLALIFSPIWARPFLHSTSFYWSAWSLILYVNVVVFSIQFFERLWQSERSSKLLWFGCFLALAVICFITMRQAGSNPLSFIKPRGNQSRFSYFFAMNIYYRQIGCVFLFILALFWKQYHLHYVEGIKGVLKLMAMLVSLLVSFYLLFITGSRGATIVGGFILVTYAVLMMRISTKWFRFLNGSLLLGLVVLFLRSSYKAVLLYSRLFVFRDPDPTSHAIQARMNYYERIFDFLKNENYMIGVGTKSEGASPFFYPHNLFLDLLYHAGIVTTVIIIIFMIMLLFQVLRPARVSTPIKFYLLVMVPIFIGAMFSGNLYNNFTIVTLCVTVLVYLKRVRRIQRLRLLKEQNEKSFLDKNPHL